MANSIKVTHCDELSLTKTGKSYRSYHIKVILEDAEKVWSDSIWPEFTIVREWRGVWRGGAVQPHGGSGNSQHGS